MLLTRIIDPTKLSKGQSLLISLGLFIITIPQYMIVYYTLEKINTYLLPTIR